MKDRALDRFGGCEGQLEGTNALNYSRELVRAMAQRMARIERGEQIVVGANKWTDGLPSPLMGGDDGGVFRADPAAAEAALASLAETRRKRDAGKVRAALADLEACARAGKPVMEASIACALARVTTGEWACTLRTVWGEYRAQTGVSGATNRHGRNRDPRGHLHDRQQRVQPIQPSERHWDPDHRK